MSIPYFYQKNLKYFCDHEKIQIIGYNPLIKGGYCQASADKIKELKMDFFQEDLLKELAKKYEKTIGQIVLNWFVCNDVIPIPGSSNPERVKENIGATEFRMSSEDVEKVSGLNKNFRFCTTYRPGGIGFDGFA